MGYAERTIGNDVCVFDNTKAADASVSIVEFEKTSTIEAEPLAPTKSSTQTHRVFISYAWEDEQHTLAVLKLADDLRLAGVDAWIDRYEGEQGPAEGWPSWMRRMITAAEFVPVICSPAYLRRVNKEEEIGIGLGATWEANIIHQELYNLSTINRKFLPVILDQSHKDSIPITLQGYTRYALFRPDGFNTLLRVLTNQPSVKAPPLGSPVQLPPDAN
jgi:hypothetical protein